MPIFMEGAWCMSGNMSAKASTPTLHPELLPPGTRVGPWRVVDPAGRGAHGTVYRALRVGQEHAPPVALKLALFPGDVRFTREVELLSRSHHPHIPHLFDHGEWEHPSGTRHPYIAMEWIDGVPLYDWARLYHPTSQQMLRLLAQLALALQYLHAQDAVHRDVKGSNTLVRRSDSRLFLTDFGSSIYPGAAPLTPSPLPPGTPAYRSPEAWLFAALHRRDGMHYTAGPADDLYALGVTACRLVTGAYPELGEAHLAGYDTWRVEPLMLPQALYSARVSPPLRALILRMLSVRPEQRGTAAQLAQVMERAATSLPDSGGPLNASKQEQVAGQNSGARASPQAHRRSWRPWIATAAAGLALATWTRWMTPGESMEGASVAQEESAESGQPDTGPVGLGDAVASASTHDSPKALGPKVMAEDTLPKPQPGQTRPDAKGRCPRKRQVALNGGCWIGLSLDQEGCAELNGYMYKGSCYVPIIPPGRSPTSSPADQP
jgi:serine/threonine protein kinase